MSISLNAPSNFSLRQVIISHGWSGLAPFGYNEARTELTYVDRLSTGRVVPYQIRQPRKHILVNHCGVLTGSETREVRRRISEMLQVNLNLSAFYSAAANEPKLDLAVSGGKGRMLRSATVFEDMVKTILTTNTTWSGTIRMVQNLVQLWGEASEGDPAVRAFPAPVTLAAVDVEDLQKDASLGYRAPYIKTLAQAVSDGILDVEGFRTSPIGTPELRKQLMAINGIGPYAAASLLMLFGRYDFLPVDSWALKLVSHEWYDGGPVKPADVDKAFEAWGEWKGLAYWFWDWNYLHDPVTGE